jgi:NitT/TauT family transport system substrate-binding protein
VRAPAVAPDVPAAASEARRPDAASGSGTARLETVTIAYPSLSMSWFPLWLADQKGIFIDEGVNAEFVQMTPTNAVAGLLTGQVDYSVALSGAAMAVAQHAAPLRVVVAILIRPQHLFMVRPEIRAYADLAGKTIAINQHLDITDWETRVVLQRNGVSPDAVTLLPVPSSPSRLAGLDSGQIAGTPLASPFDLRAEAQGHHELGRISREVELVQGGLATTVRVMAERPDLVVRVLRATLRGLEYTRTHRAEALAAVQEWLEVDAADAAAAYELGLDTWSEDGTASDEAWQNIYEVSRLASPLPTTVGIDQFVDKRFLETAWRQLHGTP